MSAIWQRRLEEPRQAGDPPSIDRPIRDDQHARDGYRLPAAFSGDDGREAELAVKGRQRPLRIRDHGLHLDHEQGGGRRVPGEDVHRASLAEDAERHLERHVPTMSSKQGDDGIHEPGVRLVEQAIETLAAPPNAEVQLRPHCRDDSLEGCERGGLDLAAFDFRDERTRHPGTLGDIRLAQAEANPDGADRPADSQAIHVAIMTARAYPLITETPA